jgi:hypothetical protein
MFGIILLGIFAICLAVSMPTDLEFSEATIPSNAISSGDDAAVPAIIMKNLTNSTRKSFFKNPEDSVETKILRNIAIQKAIKGINKKDSSSGELSSTVVVESRQDDDEDSTTDQIKISIDVVEKEESKEEREKRRVDQILQAFMNSEDFEDFIIDIEINDAIKKLRKQKGYKKRENTIFDDLFERIEREFLGDDPEEVRLIRRVGEEMEKRAREIIIERKKNRGEDATYEEELIASQLYLDYESRYEQDSSSGNDGELGKDNSGEENRQDDDNEAKKVANS